MFQPQALDDVCHVDRANSAHKLVVTAPWAKGCYSEKYGEIAQPLEWMRSFPSAARMAASVHDFALQGRIAVQLPAGVCTMTVRGRRREGVLYATTAVITSIVPAEAPFDFVREPLERVVFHGKGFDTATKRAPRATPMKSIPRQLDGNVELSDAEWEEVGPILQGEMRMKSVRLDQRAILNCILRKLASGQPWRQVVCAVGTWNNAHGAFRTWSRRGTMQRVLTALTDMRLQRTARA